MTDIDLAPGARIDNRDGLLRRNRSHAQALVEFALVVPWFFLLLLGHRKRDDFILLRDAQ